MNVQIIEPQSFDKHDYYQNTQLIITKRSIKLENGTQIVEHDLSGRERRLQGEVTVAVNRNDPDNAVAVMMDVATNDSFGGLLVATTYDGGETWLTQSIFPQFEPGFRVKNIADPMLAFDGDGRVFLTYIPVAIPNSPMAIDVVRSLDGGTTWSDPLRVSDGTGNDDKVAIAVDDQIDSPFYGNVYIAWKWPPGPTWFSRSTDHGLSFSPRQNVSSQGPSGLDLGVAGDGTVLLSYNVGSGNASRKGITVQRSDDGGVSFSNPHRVSSTKAKFETFPAAHCRNPGAFINASIDADKSTEDDTGRVFLSWVDYAPGTPTCNNPCNNDCQTVVRYATSEDSGAHWTSAQSIPASTGSQFFQWSDIDQQTGDWFVAYKDTSNDPNHTKTETFLIKSTNKGQSWSNPMILSSGSGSTNRWPGHYQGMAAHAGKIYTAWSDYRRHTTGEFYVATATEPSAQFEITGSISGPWFNAEQSGHGWFVEVLDGVLTDDPDRLIVYWYVFHQGMPVWLVANGEISGTTIELDAFIASDGEFPPDFSGADVFSWGTLSFQFISDVEGTVSWESSIDGFGSGSLPVQKIAYLSNSPQACHSGSYYNVNQSGHGISVEILQSQDADNISLAWYAYLNGEQIWLFGLSDFSNHSAVIPMMSFSGPEFPPSFDSESVVSVPWGDLIVKFENDELLLNWDPVDPRFSAGSMNMSRLTQLKGLACD